MDNEAQETENLAAVKKARDIAHGVNTSGWTEEEQEMIRSVLPSPERIWKSCQAMALKWEEEREAAGHTRTCQCSDCRALRWWEEPEDDQ